MREIWIILRSLKLHSSRRYSALTRATQCKMNGTTNSYLLRRDREESERLNQQHFLWIDTLKHYIQPSAPVKLTPTSTVGELATGTSIWLREFSKTQPSTVRLVGFDISSDQFPPKSELPSNLELVEVDALKPPPDRFLGQFDLIHIRLLIGALKTEQDWIGVAKTALALLKPGGVLQWEEGTYTPDGIRVKLPAPDVLGPATNKLVALGVKALGYERQTNMDNLHVLLNQAGFSDTVQKLVFDNDRSSPEKGRAWSSIVSGANNSIVKGFQQKGLLETEMSDEQLENLIERSYRELDEGVYFEWNLLVWIAQKPEEEEA